MTQIQIKRGLKANLQNITLAEGELAYCTDTNQLYAGTTGGSVLVNYASGGSGLPTNSYVVELARWTISNDGTNPTATTNGINNAISWAVANGYDYIKLPPGTYTIGKGASAGDKTSSATLQLMSNMVLDLTGCIVQKETNAYATYYTVYAQDIVNTTIYGGVIKGDKDTHDFTIDQSDHEGCIGVYVSGKIRNINVLGVDIYNFPGYSTSFNGYSYEQVAVTYSNIEQGSIDTTTGAPVVNTNYVRTNTSYNIASFSNILAVGQMMLSGNGYDTFGSRWDGTPMETSNTAFYIHFYDSSGNYLGYTKSRSYDQISVSRFPVGASTFKIAFRYDYTQIVPNTFWMQIMAQQQATGVSILNCKIHDGYALAITFSNAILTRIENNEFYNFGFAELPVGRKLYPFPMAIDIEDGYNANQQTVIRNNIFRDNESLHLSITQARNVIVEGNKFNGVGGMTFQGMHSSNCISRNNDYNFTSGAGQQTATYVKFENDHMSHATLQLIYENTFENCVFDNINFIGQANLWNTFATGTNYTAGTAVIPTSYNGFYYICTTAAGAAVTTEPQWGKTAGATTTDVAGNVWTCYVYNPTYDLVQFRNCKIRHNYHEGASGITLRRLNFLFQNCLFQIDTPYTYFYDLSSMWDFPSANRLVFKECNFDVSISNTTLGTINANTVHFQRTTITGAVDNNYPGAAIKGNNVLIEDCTFNSFNAELYGTQSNSTLTVRNNRFNVNKTARLFGNSTEGWRIHNFYSIIMNNNEVNVPTTTVALRPFSIFAEKYLKMTDNYFNSASTNNNLELWGAYRDSTHTSAIPSLTAIVNNNFFTGFTVKPDVSYYQQLIKSIGNGWIDLDASTEGSSSSVSTVPTSGYYYLGQTLNNSNPSPGGSQGWVVTTAGMANNASWSGSTTYAANALINSGGNVFQTLTAGKSAGTSPTFPGFLNGRVDDVTGIGTWAASTTYAVGAAVLPNLGTADPSVLPTLNLVPNANATISSVIHYVRYSWVTATGETKASGEVSLLVTAGNNLSITVPAFPTGVTKANIYVSTATNQERYQGSINSTGGTYTISAPVSIAIVPTPANLYPLTSSTGYWYECTAISTGQSNSTSPNWPKTSGAMVVDNGVTWTARGIVTWKNIEVLAVFKTYGLISN